MSADHFFIATMQSRKSPDIEERCHHAQKRQVSKKPLDYGEASIYVLDHAVARDSWVRSSDGHWLTKSAILSHTNPGFSTSGVDISATVQNKR